MKIKLHTVLFAALALVAFEGVASAQSKKKDSGSDIEEMKFEDDKLLTSNLGPDAGKIGIRGGSVRTILVRPRTSFVPEMLKSIENL